VPQVEIDDDDFDRELARGTKAFHHAQTQILVLQRAGIAEAELRKTLLRFGFGHITIEQFMGVNSVGDVLRLLEPLTRLESN
jgi:hypothetical protein